MKTLVLILMCFTAIAAETNSPSVTATNLNAHERFYVNYRANKARYQKAISELKAEISKQSELAAAKYKAGADGVKEFRSRAAMSSRISALEKEIGKLEVARVEYEQKHPDAIQYRGFTPEPLKPDPLIHFFPKTATGQR